MCLSISVSVCLCICVCVHFPCSHLKVSAHHSFFPVPPEILSLLKQSQGLNMVSLDRMNNFWWFCFVVRNYLKWFIQTTHVIYSFKKYICIIDLVSHPRGTVVMAFQSLGTNSLMTTAGQVFRPGSHVSPLVDWEESWSTCTVNSSKVRARPGALTWGALRAQCCFHAAPAHLHTW